MDHISKIIRSKKSICLIGAGQLGEMSLKLWPESKPKPIAFLDKERKGFLAGIKIKKHLGFSDQKNTLFLLSAFKINPKNVYSIFRELRQKTILTVYDFFEEFGNDYFTNGWRNLNPSRALRKSLIKLKNIFKSISSIDDKKMKGEILILNEDNTMGNLISHGMQQHKDIKFAGYNLPHLLEEKVIIHYE